MDKFLETYNLPKLNQEESENQKRQIMPNETEVVIKKLPTNQSPELDGFTGEFSQTFLEKLTHILLKIFQKIQEEGKLLSSFYKVSILQIQKPDKDTTKKENYRPKSLKNTDAKTSKNINKPNKAIHQKDHTTWSSGIYSEGARLVQHSQIDISDDGTHKQNEG